MIFYEDEEDNMLDVCFDKVSRDKEFSPCHQISGRNKSKKEDTCRQQN